MLYMVTAERTLGDERSREHLFIEATEAEAEASTDCRRRGGASCPSSWTCKCLHSAPARARQPPRPILSAPTRGFANGRGPASFNRRGCAISGDPGDYLISGACSRTRAAGRVRWRTKRPLLGSPHVLELPCCQPRPVNRTGLAAASTVVRIHCPTQRHQLRGARRVSDHDSPEYRQFRWDAES